MLLNKSSPQLLSVVRFSTIPKLTAINTLKICTKIPRTRAHRETLRPRNGTENSPNKINGAVMSSTSPLTSKDLRRIFEKLDRDRDGLVSLEELSCLLERTTTRGGGVDDKISTDDTEELLLCLTAGKRSFRFDDFVFFYDNIVAANGRRDGDSELAEAFNVFDLNGDGFISSEELQSVLERLGLWEEGTDCRSMICVFDTNLDGLLDFQEFKDMMFARDDRD